MEEICLLPICNRAENPCLGIHEALALLLQMQYSIQTLKKWLSRVYFAESAESKNIGWIIPDSDLRNVLSAASKFSLWMSQENALWHRDNKTWAHLDDRQVAQMLDPTLRYTIYASGCEGLWFNKSTDENFVAYFTTSNSKEAEVRKALRAPLVDRQ